MRSSGSLAETWCDDIPPPAELPDTSRVSQVDRWALPIRDAGVLELYGRLLGVSSSRRVEHMGHAADTVPGPYVRCGMCRWFEARIFRELLQVDTPTDRFLVHFAGRSAVPGETIRPRYEYASSALEVVELLTTRRASPGQEPFLTAPAARVLAQASGFDDELREAYLDRAVS